MGLVEDGVVKVADAVTGEEGSDFLPEGRGGGFDAVEETGERFVGWRARSPGLTATDLGRRGVATRNAM